MADALRSRGVRAGYGETVVLEDVGFALPERGSLAVLGRNGVGKTTLLATIMGHTTFHAGSIAFPRTDESRRLPVYERSRARHRLRAAGARDLPLAHGRGEPRPSPRAPGRWTLERVYDLFPRLAERRRHMGNQISGGEQQMLAIGRALMGNPSLLLMDEPLEGLAPIIVETLLDGAEAADLPRTRSPIVLVEQHAKLALEVTQDALVLNRGRIVHHGPERRAARRPAEADQPGRRAVAPLAVLRQVLQLSHPAERRAAPVLQLRRQLGALADRADAQDSGSPACRSAAAE